MQVYLKVAFIPHVLILLVGCSKSTDKDKNKNLAPIASTTVVPTSSQAIPHKTKSACPDGMILLQGGRFSRGSNHVPEGSALDERPIQEIAVATFCMDRTEVTMEAYAACVTEGVCTPAREKDPPYVWSEQFTWGKPSRGKHPINGVAFAQARAYCKHMGKRLPTENEWEFAARGIKSRLYPWGDAPLSSKLLNACDTSCRKEGKKHGLFWIAIFEEDDGFPYTAPVGSFPAGATPEGILDMEGNVGEWTEGDPCAYDKPECKSGGNIARGSSWLEQFKGTIRSSARTRMPNGESYASIGFRCAQ